MTGFSECCEANYVLFLGNLLASKRVIRADEGLIRVDKNS